MSRFGKRRSYETICFRDVRIDIAGPCRGCGTRRTLEPYSDEPWPDRRACHSGTSAGLKVGNGSIVSVEGEPRGNGEMAHSMTLVLYRTMLYSAQKHEGRKSFHVVGRVSSPGRNPLQNVFCEVDGAFSAVLPLSGPCL